VAEEEKEDDDCRPDVVELARTTVAALPSRGGNNGTATEPTPNDTDAHEDGRALGASSPPSPTPTSVLVSSPTTAVLKLSSSSSTSEEPIVDLASFILTIDTFETL
jgi:hypothetical protein